MLPSTNRDVLYDNAKFRRRSPFRVIMRSLLGSNARRNCLSCGIGKVLALIMVMGLIYLSVLHSGPSRVGRSLKVFTKPVNLEASSSEERESQQKPITEEAKHDEGPTRKKLTRLPPRLPPRTPPRLNIIGRNNGVVGSGAAEVLLWQNRQKKVAEAFQHAWNGYKSFAMGYDELMPVSQRGVNGLGGLGATIVDALDTALIMGLDDIAEEAGSWIQKELPTRLKEAGQVNLFETTIRVLGGLLSAYHLSGGHGNTGGVSDMRAIPTRTSGTKPEVYLEIAKDLADRLLVAFTSSPTPIPFSDVVLRDRSAHPAGNDGGASSTSEVTTLQLEFLYLSNISGDPKYGQVAMRVLEHFRTLSKYDGLVPILVSPHTGQFQGNNIRLGSRGDSYYEYLLKVWLHQGGALSTEMPFSYLREMYDVAMESVKRNLVRKSIPKGLVFVGELPNGPQGSFSPKMDHLVCFLAGNLALGASRGLTKMEALKNGSLSEKDFENLQLAEDLSKTCYEMYVVTTTGLAPEIAYFHTEGQYQESMSGGNASAEFKEDIIIKPLDRHNLLRPETVESLFLLYRITEDAKYRAWGWEIFEAFERHTKVASGGYSSLDDVTRIPSPKRDKMETFFLGETLKYLYLLFGETTVLPLDKYVFNTEAHPFPIISQVTSES